ncbi:MAG: glycosyltransferase family 4 protein [Muribaculaceae bacterium]|nr:glycosyltransferase family 4 protein [Muribaculaceae bacterium]
MNKGKILFIHQNLRADTGGSNCQKRNLSGLQILYGTENVFTINMDPVLYHPSQKFYKRVIRKILGFDPDYYTFIKKNILNLIIDKNINIVWIDSSTLGNFAKLIKNKFREITVITFFHNFEYKFYSDKNKNLNKKFFRKKQEIYRARKNEINAIRFSDKKIALSLNEKRNIENYYQKSLTDILPISLPDKYNETNIKSNNPKKIENLLFVGSYFFGNVEGIKWFIESILPHINCHLTVIGNGMEKLIEDIKPNNNLRILGYTENLQDEYLRCDAVIMPIISGAGMKVKVAEALMYGKFIFGTPNALEGYEIPDGLFSICSTPKDFIDSINNTCVMKYNYLLRETYLNKYSFESTLTFLKNIMFNY